ncbi:hypothetical protein [Longimicrobium sp.]|uniref:hypothetical protein n=1 Tax=Longimicrobium sp. TaxID=2029185 RepID=UPI002B9A29BB|nr:hypothetical protein [Longimicrobium sp.]HSU17551.1 hypothetical protein [Longimicrobium sp.]
MSPHDEMDNELTPAERALFDALPREREPGRLLEERTVRALRERGLVHAPAAPATARRIRFPAAWVSGAIAAGIALFLGGLATGQYVASRNTTQLVTAMQQRDAQQAALMVQQTGTAYVQALSRLSQVSDTTRAGRQQGREVASSMLRAAADEVVRMNPNDPVASGILAAFDRAKTQAAPAQRDTAGKQSVVWF